MKKRLQYLAFLATFGFFLFLLATIGYYHLRHTVFDGGFWVPSIAVEPLSVHFGNVSLGDDVRREIMVRNTGWSALVLERVRPSCASCVVIESFTKEPISPGKQGKIEFSLDLSRNRGDVETTFAVVSNGENQKVVVVRVSANILTENQ